MKMSYLKTCSVWLAAAAFGLLLALPAYAADLGKTAGVAGDWYIWGMDTLSYTCKGKEKVRCTIKGTVRVMTLLRDPSYRFRFYLSDSPGTYVEKTTKLPKGKKPGDYGRSKSVKFTFKLPAGVDPKGKSLAFSIDGTPLPATPID
ncbi:MAG: hypothetical protein HYY01_15375 [Chloroflexi bacterium]|nr:hypothetical protein [Chloroflexota bacterium]